MCECETPSEKKWTTSNFFLSLRRFQNFRTQRQIGRLLTIFRYCLGNSRLIGLMKFKTRFQFMNIIRFPSNLFK